MHTSEDVYTHALVMIVCFYILTAFPHNIGVPGYNYARESSKLIHAFIVSFRTLKIMHRVRAA